MNEAQRNAAMRKLANLQFEIDKTQSEKNDLNRGYNETIKEYKKRITAYAKALKTNDLEFLESGLSESEYQYFLDIKQ